MKITRKIRTITIVSAAFAATIAVASLAVYAGWGKHGSKSMHRGMIVQLIDQIDSDQDGTLSRQEIDAHRQQKLAEHDASQDGSLQLMEFQSLWLELAREKMVDHFQYLDQDGDGRVTDAELAEPLHKMVAYRDANNDGALDRDELRFHHRKHGHDRYHDGRDGDHDD